LDAATRNGGEQRDQEPEADQPQLQRRPEVGVLDQRRVEEIEPIDEDPLLCAEPVPEERTLADLARGADPGGQAPARHEE